MSRIGTLMSSLSNHLRLDSWFNLSTLLATNPPAQWNFMWAYLVFLGICFLGTILCLVIRFYLPLRTRLTNLFLTNVVLGAILFFFRYQQVPLLGMDILRTLQEIGFVIWLIIIVSHIRVAKPKEALAALVEERRTKYLPKPKKK
jgi:hypothetical protein